MAGNAKVLPEHVARKNVGGHQVLDGVAVFDHGAFQLLVGLAQGRVVRTAVGRQGVEGFLQINVERDHAPLDVDVLQNQFDLPVAIAVGNFELAGRKLLQLGHQFGLETLQRKRHVRKLQRVGHAPHPVVLLDELVLGPNLLAGGVFLVRVKVLDDLEHERKARQVEHQHHHALDTGRDTEAVGAVPLVEQVVAVEQRFTLLGQPQCVVELGTRFARHHAAQKLHIGTGHRHVHHEIGARKTEQDEEVVLPGQQRVDHQLALRVVQDGQGKRHFTEPVDELAHHVGTLVPVEQAGQYLHLEVGAQAVVVVQRLQPVAHSQDVALQIIKRHQQPEIGDQLPQFCQQVVLTRVIRPVGGRLTWV